jgi:hypothetical protein
MSLLLLLLYPGVLPCLLVIGGFAVQATLHYSRKRV